MRLSNSVIENEIIFFLKKRKLFVVSYPKKREEDVMF